MSGAESSASQADRRVRSRDGLDRRHLMRQTLQIGQAVAVIGLLAWLILRGASSLDYRWQWYRLGPYFYKIVDGQLIWGPLIKGLVETLRITALSAVLTVLIGLATALARMSNSFAGRVIATGYLEAIRNTPLLVQLFLFYFVLAPILGVDRFWSGVLCLAFFEGSFAAEIIRGGIQGVDRGQWEAADATGLTRSDRFRFVILPQALPLILPPLTGLLISLIKHSAIVSVIAVPELTTAAKNLISKTFMAFEVWFVVAALYLAVTITLSVAVSLFERKLTRNRR